MSRLSRLMSAGLVLMAIVGYGAIRGGSREIVIDGRVVENANGREMPVAGAKVSIDGDAVAARTDDRGRFRLHSTRRVGSDERYVVAIQKDDRVVRHQLMGARLTGFSFELRHTP